MTDQHSCPSKDDLITYLYDETDPALAGRLEAHLRGCATCAAEVDALGGVRAALAQWAAPDLPVHVRLEAAAPPPSVWTRRWLPAAGLAAAALLVLAASAGLANLEVRYDAEGLSVRTGWGRAAPPAVVPTPQAAGLVAAPVAAPSEPPPAPWRTELATLETDLRAELRTLRTQAMTASGPPTADWLRQVQALIDESEVRQQRNLALRVAELSRDFDLQRKADLVTVQQGLGRLESRTEAEAARARQMMNYIVRVSQQQQR